MSDKEFDYFICRVWQEDIDVSYYLETFSLKPSFSKSQFSNDVSNNKNRIIKFGILGFVLGAFFSVMLFLALSVLNPKEGLIWHSGHIHDDKY